MTFRAPVADLAFALKAAGHAALLGEAYPDLDAETVQAVLEAAGLFATDVLAPLNRAGDKHGARNGGQQVQGMPATETAQSDDTDIYIFHVPDSIVFVDSRKTPRAGFSSPRRFNDKPTNQRDYFFLSGFGIIASRTIDSSSW